MDIKVMGQNAKVVTRAARRPGSMHNGLTSTQDARHWDYCNGIHGAARARRSAKRATSAARRRLEKLEIQAALEEDA